MSSLVSINKLFNNFILVYLQRIGVTLKNPNCPQTNVVRAVTDLFIDDCKDFWVLSGSRLHNGTLEKEYSLNIHSLKVNDCIGVQVTSKGELVYYYNGVNKGVAITGIPIDKEIYGIFDVYGRTKEVVWQYFGGNVTTILWAFKAQVTIHYTRNLFSSFFVLCTQGNQSINNQSISQ